MRMPLAHPTLCCVQVYLVRHQDGRRLAYKQITCKKDPNVEPANCAATIQEARAEAALHVSSHLEAEG